MSYASVAIQVLPKTDVADNILKVIDRVIAYIGSFGLNYVVGPFETTIEGDYDVLMEIVRGCQRIAVEAGADSVMTYVKIAYHPSDKGLTIEEKIAKYS